MQYLAAESGFKALRVRRIIYGKGASGFKIRESREIIAELKQAESSLRHPSSAKIQKFGRKCEPG
jgi:hypothetical protein